MRRVERYSTWPCLDDGHDTVSGVARHPAHLALLALRIVVRLRLHAAAAALNRTQQPRPNAGERHRDLGPDRYCSPRHRMPLIFVRLKFQV